MTTRLNVSRNVRMAFFVWLALVVFANNANVGAEAEPRLDCTDTYIQDTWNNWNEGWACARDIGGWSLGYRITWGNLAMGMCALKWHTKAQQNIWGFAKCVAIPTR